MVANSVSWPGKPAQRRLAITWFASTRNWRSIPWPKCCCSEQRWPSAWLIMGKASRKGEGIMLTAEGCRQRRHRLWQQLDPKPENEHLLLADPIHLAYPANA